jgi:hypothetical protein
MRGRRASASVPSAYRGRFRVQATVVLMLLLPAASATAAHITVTFAG